MVAPASPGSEWPHAQRLRGAPPGRSARGERPILQLAEQKQPQLHHGNVNLYFYLKAFWSIEINTVTNYLTAAVCKNIQKPEINRPLCTLSCIHRLSVITGLGTHRQNMTSEGLWGASARILSREQRWSSTSASLFPREQCLYISRLCYLSFSKCAGHTVLQNTQVGERCWLSETPPL